MMLVLSLFPGIGLLDMAFEEAGFCVVRGPDLLWGGDIRKFNPPSGKFDGVIGGPPCQAFSALAALVRHNGHEPKFGNLIPEFERVVFEAGPTWFLMENVKAAPAPNVQGFEIHEQLLNNRWLGEEQNRLRRFSFGTRDGRKLRIETSALEAAMGYVNGFAVTARHSGRMSWMAKPPTVHAGHDATPGVRSKYPGSVTSSDGSSRTGKARMCRYPYPEACRLQGLPEDFLGSAPFTAQGKLQAVANGVPLPMGRAVAKAVMLAICPPSTTCPTSTPTTSTTSKT